MTAAQLILGTIGAYLALGVGFAAWFVLRGVRRMDPGTAHAPIGFFLLIFPGAVALWPLLLARLGHVARGSADIDPPDWARGARRRHQLVWLVLALLIPLGLVAGLAARSSGKVASPEPSTLNASHPR